MSGHTPGPWYVGAQNDILYIVAGKPPSPSNDYPDHGAPRLVVAKVMSGAELDDARLITTAPDGLALAQSILADCTDATPVEWIEMARGIVAKAEGCDG